MNIHTQYMIVKPFRNRSVAKHAYLYRGSTYMYVHDLRLMKQQLTIQIPRHAVMFEEKNELTWVGFEPMTFCILGRALTD